MKLRFYKRKNTLAYINKPKKSFLEKFIDFTSVLGAIQVTYETIRWLIKVIDYLKDFFK